MGKRSWLLFAMTALLVLSFAVVGCGNDDKDESKENGSVETTEVGTLIFTADGEEHAREGTTSKEGWEIDFENLYVTVGNIKAYQTDPPYDTDTGWAIDYDEMVDLSGVFTVDLADESSDPAELASYDKAPAGNYNALSWNMLKAKSGEFEGYSIVLIGNASKDGQEVQFTLKIDREVAYQGGEYIGDERKGMLKEGGTAEMEMTFHIDHLFGRDDKSTDDEMNISALGFDPIAQAATDGVIEADMAELKELLNEEDYEKLEAILLHFGHVGEGHCLAKNL